MAAGVRSWGRTADALKQGFSNFTTLSRMRRVARPSSATSSCAAALTMHTKQSSTSGPRCSLGRCSRCSETCVNWVRT